MEIVNVELNVVPLDTFSDCCVELQTCVKGVFESMKTKQ